jgi:hypothetical protein
MFDSGSTQISFRALTQRWCAPSQRKRPIDLVMLSIGGNDVGFSALAAYSMTESASDLAPIVALIGKQIRFGPEVSRVYLQVLDKRMKAVKDALRDGFGVEPARVLQTSYEPMHFDEKGQLCGLRPTLGMNVHSKLKVSRARIEESANFVRELWARLECISSTSRRKDCPAGLATGTGTGFTLITEHIEKFSKRGMCARDPRRPEADGQAMGMPRRNKRTDEFEPYSPDSTIPYAHHWRLFRTPNDAFLLANTHMEGISLFDIIQPAYAALYSGAIHPSAEGHAIVADTVMPYARKLLDKESVAERHRAAER